MINKSLNSRMATAAALLTPILCMPGAVSAKSHKNSLPDKVNSREQPNVIIILADDLGYGDLECYGAKNVSTPNVNRLADQGIKFTNTQP